jgi:hypothetical protein
MALPIENPATTAEASRAAFMNSYTARPYSPISWLPSPSDLPWPGRSNVYTRCPLKRRIWGGQLK